ncbi:type II-A CRISPR-associated protein Csn2 [Weissella soli]|uniref:type II-A CRISPR-associated protein Csn2 n=1 Tax=Weissella soli TaxID=155866 RepID=UPI001F264956|nr:type II-A CRISPR-associated protein Csn2 [Weissella soli]GJM47891.1 CRISPR-associated protein Csn2 [Weissella soli]
MINLNFDFLDTPLQIEGLTSLTIQDRTVFTKVVQETYRYSGEDDYLHFFDDNYRVIKPVEMMLINDILGFDVNSAPTLKLIYKDIENQINHQPEKKTLIEQHLNAATEIIQNELLDFEIDMVSDEIDVDEALKVLGVKIEIATDTMFERLFEIIQVFKYLRTKKLLVLINAGIYFSEQELTSLEQYAELQNIALLMIDNQKLTGIQSRYFLDGDYVLIREFMV